MIVRWIAGTVAMWLSIYIVNAIVDSLAMGGTVKPAAFHIEVNGIWGPLLFVFVLSLVNVVARPLIAIVTCPFRCLTFGLASVLLHGLVFYLVGNHVPGLDFPCYISAFVTSIVYSILAGAIFFVTGEQKGRRRR